MIIDSTPAPRPTRRPLRVSATVELASLAVLLVNMATGNAQEIAALFGPLHGVAWLFGLLAAWRDPRRSPGAVLRALVPGIGGWLALRALERADAQVEAQTAAPAAADTGADSRAGAR